MRKWLCGALAALMMILTLACALADSEGVVVQSSCSVVASGEYHLVYCYAQIHNNSNEIICLENGSFELLGGDQVLATQEVTQIWPYFINPGEDGYVFDMVAFEPDENGNPVVPQITGLTYDIAYMTVDQRYAALDLSAVATIEQDAGGGITVECAITNGNLVDAYDPTVAFGLYTDGGAMVYADGLTLRNVGLPAGETMLIRFPIDDAVSEQWRNYGANITSAHVNASFASGSD